MIASGAGTGYSPIFPRRVFDPRCSSCLSSEQSALVTIGSSKAGSALAGSVWPPTHAVHLALERHHPPARRTPDGGPQPRTSTRPRLSSRRPESPRPDPAGATCGGLQSHEHSGRRLIEEIHTKKARQDDGLNIMTGGLGRTGLMLGINQRHILEILGGEPVTLTVSSLSIKLPVGANGSKKPAA